MNVFIHSNGNELSKNPTTYQRAALQRLFSNTYFEWPLWARPWTKLRPNTYLSSPKRYHVNPGILHALYPVVHWINNLNIKLGTGISWHCPDLFILSEDLLSVLGERCCSRAGMTMAHTTESCLPGAACGPVRDTKAHAGSKSPLCPLLSVQKFLLNNPF